MWWVGLAWVLVVTYAGPTGGKRLYGGDRVTQIDGKSDADLSVPIAAGEHELVAKVETADGVAIFDLRHLTRE